MFYLDHRDGICFLPLTLRRFLNNARLTSLEDWWRPVFGKHHGLLVLNGFRENVKRHRMERRELQPEAGHDRCPINLTREAALAWLEPRGRTSAELFEIRHRRSMSIESRRSRSATREARSIAVRVPVRAPGCKRASALVNFSRTGIGSSVATTGPTAIRAAG